MSKKIKDSKQLLEGKTIRRFMELANLPKEQINEYCEKKEEGARLEPELDTVEEEIGSKRAMYEQAPEKKEPIEDEEIPMDDAPMDDAPIDDVPIEDEPLPEPGEGEGADLGAEEEVVKNMVDAIADAIEQSTGVEVSVSGAEGDMPAPEEAPMDDMPAPEEAPMGDAPVDELPPAEGEDEFPEEDELEESAKEPWKGGSDQDWKKLSEKQIVSEVARRVIERLKKK